MTKLDWNGMEAFVRVVQAGSFTVAARKLGLPVSSVSRAVSRLENDLGVRLLHRTTRKLRASDAGAAFFQRVQSVVSEAEEAARLLAGFAEKPHGLVRISAAPGAGDAAFARVLARVAERYPEVSVDLVLTNRFVDLVGEGIDFALRGGKLDDSSLIARKLSDSSLRMFAAPAYLERRGAPRTPAALATHDCLVYGSSAKRTLWRLHGPRGEHSVGVRGPVACDDLAFLRDAASAGLGIALLPEVLALAAVRAGKLRPVLPRYSVPGGGLFLVWPSQRLVPARVVAVRELLVEELSRLYAEE